MVEKIVFFDIDETLLDKNKQIPLSTKNSINKIKEQGIEVAIATGRAPTMFKHICDELGINSYVSCNGSLVSYKGKIIYREYFQEQLLNRLEESASDKGHAMVFSTQEEIWTNKQDDVYVNEVMKHLSFHSIPPYRSYSNRGVCYALIFCELNEEQYLSEFKNLRFLRWHKYTMDIIPQGGSKARGVEKMLDYLGISRENSIAFGDGINDLEMLNFVGTGVAMGNAVSELKKVADFVTTNVDDNGIESGLRNIGLLKF